MPSSRRIQLNISVERQLKTEFKALCERENVSLASAIQGFMRRSIDRGTLTPSDSHHNQLATNFSNREREIETLKNLAANYSAILNNFNSLQERVSRLEEELHRGWGI